MLEVQEIIRGEYIYGGANPGSTNTIEFITIATAGNAQDFGDATAAKSGLGALASPTRACFGGGQDNTIEFVTIATTGNASDFGDLISGTTEKPDWGLLVQQEDYSYVESLNHQELVSILFNL